MRVILALPLMLAAAVAAALDFPHTPSNPTVPDLSCLNCHDLDSEEAKLLKPSAPHPEMGGSDTNPNNLCWSCHIGPQLAPYRAPHSSQQTSDQFGDWFIECRTCHNPHYQPQLARYGEEAYLASGTISQVTSGALTSTLTDSAADWREDEHAGRVLFPNVDASDDASARAGGLSYRVLGNSATTLTIDGAMDLTRIAPGDRYAIVYGKLIKAEIEIPGSGSPGVRKRVKFFRSSGPNSYADGDSTLDGICQVCHTRTAHFRNDGGGADQLHRNASRESPDGVAGESCTSKCHQHAGGFGHGKGDTRVELCIECHGHEPGTYYMVDGRYPYNPADASRLSLQPSRGFGSTAAHSTHTESWIDAGDGWGETVPAGAGADDRRGPGIYCDSCHDIHDMPAFRSGTDRNEDGRITLDETDVCDDCHSPGGSYNGVDSVGDSVGAKDNWLSGGVYRADNTTLKPGKEKWCAGCHDEWQPTAPAASRIDTARWDAAAGIARGIDVVAPPVIGDEDAPYNYGTGWGFYKTGHGLPSDQKIPSSGGTKPGPGVECNDCHDPRLPHIDGRQRSYDCADGCDPAEYQSGYRLKYPMQIPLTDGYRPPRESNYQLCFSCHDFEAVTDAADGGNGPQTSNYYDDTQSPNRNLHYRHLARGAINSSSDWSGNWNSKLTCIVCHNPHGTTNLAMIRTGRILEVDPDAGAGLKRGIRIWYGNADITSNASMVAEDYRPDPPDLTLSASDRTYFWGALDATGYCAEVCHGNTIYEITRTPVQSTDQPPMLEWAGGTGFESDGASPDAVTAGGRVTFRVKYRDWDNDAPDAVYLWVDVDSDGQFEAASERFAMEKVPGQTVPPSSGWEYRTAMRLSRIGSGVVEYYFEAVDGDGAATGPATQRSALRILNAVPQLAWVGGAGYEHDGVEPDTGGDGASFTFRVRYSDGEGTPPASIRLLEDLDGDGIADARYTMTPEAGGDDATGRVYRVTRSIRHAETGGGTVRYAFRASDGEADATGAPTDWSRFSVLASGNTPAVLQWVNDAADCRVDSASPPLTLQTGAVTFRLKYTDPDDWGAGPASVTLQVDLDGDGRYDGGAERIAMSRELAGSDDDWRNGEYYRATATPTASGRLKYRFEAVDVGTGDRADAAVGAPATTDRYLTLYDHRTARGVRTAPPAAGVWHNDLQSAIDAIDGAHTVLVMPGTYVQDVAILGSADSDTTLRSACGADLTILRATSSAADALLLQNLSGRTLIDGFQITASDTGIHNNSGGILEVRNSRIHGNGNSGIFLGGGARLLLSDSEIYANSATRGGGLFFNAGSDHTIRNTTFRDNHATDTGGAILVQNTSGPLRLENVTLSNNSAGGAGGAIRTNRRPVEASRCTLSGNRAGTEGGAVYLDAAGSFDNCVITGNSAGSRGGAFMLNAGPTVTFTNSTLADNVAATLGGAIFSNGGAVTLNSSILWDNRSETAQGHAVYANGGALLQLSDVIVQNDGDADPFDAPVFAPASSRATVGGYHSENDPNFRDAARGDYRIQPLSDAIDHAGPGALADDRDGHARDDADIGAYEHPAPAGHTPTLSWTGEAGFVADAVHPDRAPGGTEFEFRVDYSHAGGLPPAFLELWLDANDNGAFEASERHAMTRHAGAAGRFGDGDFRNGERYGHTVRLRHTGDGVIHYRFFAAAKDGRVATGDPVQRQPLVVDNGVPVLSWPGEGDFEEDGVHPDRGAAGEPFLFRVRYRDADGDAPGVAQVWIDANDDHRYAETEKHDLEREGAGADYRSGETYRSPPIVLHSAGDERLRYRFYFTDGKNTAVGAPTRVNRAKERYSRYVVVSETPALRWTGEPDYLSDGVYPDSAVGSANFEFRVEYSDPLNRPPASIAVWVDANDDGRYEADERHAMLASDQSDDDYRDGKIYSRVLSLSAAGDENIPYRFFASNGMADAAGAPATEHALHIDFPQSVSGRVYADRDMTPVADGTRIRLVHNGMMAGSGVTTDGAYTIPAIYSPGDSLIACIEGAPFHGSSTVVSTSGDVTGLDLYAGADTMSWECLRYVSYRPADNATNITTARAVPAPGADDAIEVSMGYTGDADANNRYRVRYCVQSACDRWTDHQVEAAHTASPYTTTITGLTAGETYRVRLRYLDDQVNGTNPVEISDITLPYNATTAGVATASARSVDSILVTLPYRNDANGNNRYMLEYRRSGEPAWHRWGEAAWPHAAAPFTAVITGLETGGTYDVRVTYLDADGFTGGEPPVQVVRNIGLANNGTTVLAASATAGRSGSIDISMPYLHDLNGDNTYRIEYKDSAAGAWREWGRFPHAPSPFVTTITGLEANRSYDVRMTIHDRDGIIAGLPQQMATVRLPYGDEVVCQSDCSGIGAYHSSIQAAIDAAGDGDVVVVLPGVYAENLTLGLNPADRVDITLRSRDGAASVTVTGTGADAPVVWIAGGNGSRLQGLTINNALSGGGLSRGLLISEASPVIEQSIIEDNVLASYRPGGGVRISSGSAVIRQSWIRGNNGDDGSGIYCFSGTVTLINSIVSGNGQPGQSNQGGGLHVAAGCSATVINSTFSGNRAQNGGAINGPGSVTAKYSLFWGDRDEYYGPGELAAGYDVTYSVVEGGYAGRGNRLNDPKFVSPVPAEHAPTVAGDYRLQGYTHTPDAVLDLSLQQGDTLDPLAPAVDYEGDPRPSGAGYTMGADEVVVP